MNQNFWNIKAEKYPKAYDKDNIKSFNETISRLKKLGVCFDDKKILDIGCGPGNYSILFADVAAEVFGLDFSSDMIYYFSEQVKNSNIKNIFFEQALFEQWDCYGKHKYFDIAFASMTPAIKTEEDVMKMESLTKGDCVFIGWAGKRKNDIADKVLLLHEISPYMPKGFYNVKDILIKRKIKFKEEIFESSWNWRGDIEEAYRELSSRVRLEGKRPNKNLIVSFLKKEFPSGKVLMTTQALKGILVWRP